jgi:tRNA 2-thiouridine synthesizing protein A
MSETLLDVKGMNCPLPVLRANRALRGMAPGSRLRVLATDRAAVADFQAFCRETGHALVASSEDGGVFSFVIRRRPDAAPAAPQETGSSAVGVQPLDGRSDSSDRGS